MIYQWPLSLAACSLIRNNSPSPMNNQSSYPERMHSGIANNACLKIEGTNDQFQDDKHKDWKEVSNVLYAIHQSRAVPYPPAAGIPVTVKLVVALPDYHAASLNHVFRQDR